MSNSEAVHWNQTNGNESVFYVQIKHPVYLPTEIKSCVNIRMNANIGFLLEKVKDSIQRNIKYICECHQFLNVDKYVNVDPNISLTKNKEDVSEETLIKDILRNDECLEFQIFNQFFTVLINVPYVRSMSLVYYIFVDMELKPSKIKACSLDRDKTEFYWFKSLDKIEWTFLDFGFKYKITTKDVDHYLKLVCKPKSLFKDGPPFEIITQNVVKTQSVLTYPFEDRHKYNDSLTSGNM